VSFQDQFGNSLIRAYASPQWLTEEQVNHKMLSESDESWLFERDSLTARIQSRCPGQFRVRVLNEEYGIPRWHESRALDVEESLCCFIRQVYLEVDGTPIVYARTVIPLSTLTGPERRLADLKNQPLGAVLFADRSMRRKPLEVARFEPGHYIYEVATRPLQDKPAGIWGRRSVYYLHDKGLLVSEIFLPTISRCA
jgi:chorismate--pyruvate lyase